MDGRSRWVSAAHRWTRARRWLLLGNKSPFLARYAPSDLATPDPAEDGPVAVQIWARWRVAEKLDAGLERLTAVRIDRGGEAFGIGSALHAMALEDDREAAAGMLKALAKASRAPVLELGSQLARAVELAAERGAPQLVEAAEVEAARELLTATEEPVRDVLSWTSLRSGRPRRSPLALVDALRVLRSRNLDPHFRPTSDPWPAFIAWREKIGLGLNAITEVAASREAWPGSWALRGQRSRVVGTSGWPGAQRARFALQGLGRLDTLAEGGYAALLPREAAATQLLAAAGPMLLCEPGFLVRVFGEGATHESLNPDLSRQLALAELLWQRLQAAAVLLWSAFESSREVGAVLDAAGAVSRALCAPVPADLAIVIAAPWTDGLSAWPRASLAAAVSIADWREGYDQDFWRNPRFAEPLRALASRAAQEKLDELVPTAKDGGVAALAKWAEANLGR